MHLLISFRNPLKLRIQKKGWRMDLRMYMQSPFHTLLHVRLPHLIVVDRICPFRTSGPDEESRQSGTNNWLCADAANAILRYFLRVLHLLCALPSQSIVFVAADGPLW
jgi:hypothetical protein